jgi:hypothetical protein
MRSVEEAWRVMRLPGVEQQLQGRAVDVQVRLRQPASDEQQHMWLYTTYNDLWCPGRQCLLAKCSSVSHRLG